MNVLDEALFALINADSMTWGAMAWLAYFCAKYVIFGIPIHLVVAWFTGAHRARREVIALTSALVIAISISSVIGWTFPTDRPFLIPVGHQLIEHRPSPSFPSNHGLVMFTYASTMFLLGHRRYAVCIAALGGFVAWSRIYLGIHFPFDMIGALILAILVSRVAFSLDRLCGPIVTLSLERAFNLIIRPIDRIIRGQR